MKKLILGTILSASIVCRLNAQELIVGYELDRLSLTGGGPGIELTWRLNKIVRGDRTNISIPGYYGSCTVHRNGVPIANVAGNNADGYTYSFRDLGVRAGAEPSYKVTWGGCSVGPKSVVCLLNYFADVSAKTVKLDATGGEETIAIIGKKEMYDRRKKTYSETDVSWTATCSASWLTLSRPDDNSLRISANACPNSVGRKTTIKVVIEGYIAKRIIVAQGCETSDDDEIVSDGDDDIVLPAGWRDGYAYPSPYSWPGKWDIDKNPVYLWEEYVAGTDPSDSNSVFRADIVVTNNMPYIIWTPNLNTNGEVRVYTVMGKTNLTDSAWVCPTNSAHRFFKVKVEMP